MYLKTSLPLLLLGLTMKAAADSGYGATCNSLTYYNGNGGSVEIYGNCEYPDGGANVGTVINVNSCFANSNGNLVGQLNGGYAGSCKDVSLSGTILSGQCKNDAGTYVSTSIDTNDWIGNYDGLMECFGQNGH